MSASLELEIKALLDEVGSPSAVAERLIPYIEGSEDNWTAENILSLCRFLLFTGCYLELISFVLRHFRRADFKIPWPYFIEAIALSRPQIDDTLADDLLQGIEKTKARSYASRSKALDLHAPAFKAERADRRIQAVKAYRREKEQLLEQLVTLRTQQLYEQEKLVLAKLHKMFPNDVDILKEGRDHKERHALEVLERRGRFQKRVKTDDLMSDAEVEALRPALVTALNRAVDENPEFAEDLAVVAATLEMWEEALSVLGEDPGTASGRWLRMELLLLAGHHLELLTALAVMESVYATDPETFFATAYLRAQAYWGLGQKETAVEVMESLLATSPQYRAGVSLLRLWRRK